MTYEFSLRGPTTAALVFDGDRAVAFQPRVTLVDKVRRDSGLRLCGAGVRCTAGAVLNTWFGYCNTRLFRRV